MRRFFTYFLCLWILLLPAACASFTGESRQVMRKMSLERRELLAMLHRSGAITDMEYGAACAELDRLDADIAKDEGAATADRWLDILLAGGVAAAGVGGAGPAVRGATRVVKAMKKAAAKPPA